MTGSPQIPEFSELIPAPLSKLNLLQRLKGWLQRQMNA
jgi:hypothetical protein